MKLNFKLSSLLMLLVLFLVAINFVSCDDEDQLTSQDLYQTSWRGIAHCESWIVPKLGIDIQFIDTQKGRVNWESHYEEFKISYTIESKYIVFNSDALYLGGAPWVIKSYTKNHMTLMQNESSQDKEKIAIIELDRTLFMTAGYSKSACGTFFYGT